MDGIDDWIEELGLQDSLDELAGNISHEMANRGVMYYRNFEHLKAGVATALCRRLEDEGIDSLSRALVADLVKEGYVERDGENWIVDGNAI